jgi:hypothetical protein
MTIKISLSALALCCAVGAAQPTFAQTLTLDDFSTGHYKKTLPAKTSAIDIHVATGNMIGGFRETQFLMCHQVPCTTGEDEFDVSSAFQVGSSKRPGVPSALVFSAGYKALPRLDVFYGIDGPDIVPLHLNLTPYDRLRVSFDGLNSIVNFNLQLYSPTGNGQLGCNLGPGSLPFTVDFPIADFVPGTATIIDTANITYLNMISQSGGFSDLGTLAFAITKLEAVPASVPPASITCTGN